MKTGMVSTSQFPVARKTIKQMMQAVQNDLQKEQVSNLWKKGLAWDCILSSHPNLSSRVMKKRTPNAMSATVQRYSVLFIVYGFWGWCGCRHFARKVCIKGCIYSESGIRVH